MIGPAAILCVVRSSPVAESPDSDRSPRRPTVTYFEWCHNLGVTSADSPNQRQPEAHRTAERFAGYPPAERPDRVNLPNSGTMRMVESPRAAILLDVDGPLNPYPRRGRPPPTGYLPFVVSHRIIPAVPPIEQRVLLHPERGRDLLRLAQETNAELVWATAWEHEADRLLGPLLGLPALEVIVFEDTGIRHRDGLHGKLPTIDRWAGRRPLCWFDDEFQPADGSWAERRSDSGAPTRLIPVDRHTGLQRQHLDAARAFLRQWGRACPDEPPR